jgi:hypothetical protein
MIKYLLSLWYGIPYHYTNKWYNAAAYDKQWYPKIFDEKDNYIYPKRGVKVIMNHLKDGRPVYYEISHIISRLGGDWLNDTDRINVDLVFSHIGKKESNG